MLLQLQRRLTPSLISLLNNTRCVRRPSCGGPRLSGSQSHCLHRLSPSFCLDSIGDVLVAVAHTLVTTDFGVLAFALLHESLKLGVIALGNGLGLHSHCEVATGFLNVLLDPHDSLLQALDAEVLVEAGVCENVKRWGHKSDLDLHFLGVIGLSGAESSLDSVDTLVAVACDVNVGADLGRLRCESLADVELDLIGNRLAGKGDIVPDFGVTGRY